MNGEDFLVIKAKGNRSRGITIYCSDGKKYGINPVCINDILRDDISKLERNVDIAMLLHPGSNEIVELTANNVKLLNFDEILFVNETNLKIWCKN